MGDARFQLLGLRDPRLAPHATSAHPAWLWSSDGSQLLWCNAPAADALALTRPLRLQPHAPTMLQSRQAAQLSARMTNGAVRLERLRDFGKPLGGLVTCACTRIDFDAATSAVLIVAMELLGRAASLKASLQWLIDGLDQPACGFDSTGELLARNDRAREIAPHLGGLADVSSDAERLALGQDATQATVALLRWPQTQSEAASEASPIASTAGAAPLTAPAGAETAGAPPPENIWTTDRRYPLRFVWQMNAEGRFSLGGDEFSRMLGPQTAAALGRPWDEIVRAFGLDPEGRVAKAVATRDTWSGVVVKWPFDDFGHRLPVELSALPMHDRHRNFLGYRGFGVCYDLDGLNRIAAIRQQEGLFGETVAARADLSEADAGAQASAIGTADPPQPAQPHHDVQTLPERQEPSALHQQPRDEPPLPQASDAASETANVVPFRPLGEPTTPVLTQVENNAFDEIARRLSEGLGAAKLRKPADAALAPEIPAEPEAEPDAPAEPQRHDAPVAAAKPAEPPPTAAWLSPAAAAPVGNLTDRRIFDLMPAGILIYRLDRLLYANAPLLQQLGFADLPALLAKGGLEALEIAPQSAPGSSASAEGLPLTIASATTDAKPVAARLYAIEWDGEAAHALILAPPEPKPAEPAQSAAAQAKPDGAATDLHAILEAATDAIVLFDRSGAVTTCNRRAQTLFGYPPDEFRQRNLTDLFAFESQRIVLDYFETVDQPAIAALHDHGREVVGCRNDGHFLTLSMTMGRSDQDGERFFAVFRDLSQLKEREAELLTERRRADRANSAKSDALAKISHDIRTPLNTIIGFANMMIEEKLGTLGNSRYLEYTKDIRASAERVLTIINDMLDLSDVETGRLKLSFQRQSLNETIEKCVSLAQPQANRERIIIRTSLAHQLPPISADPQSLRQIAMILISSSIRLSKAGGQVIVSTALDETRQVVLRVRDMGRGLSDTEIASTMEPYRAQALSDMMTPESGVDLSLAKALAEANRARFHIKTTPQAGTLIEIAFPTD